MAKKTERTPFGERAEAARRQAQLTQKDVCLKLGIRQSTLGDIETKSEGSTYTAQLAHLYKVDAYWLATGIGKMETEAESWRDLAMKLATAQDFAERGQKYITFLRLVDVMHDRGKAEQALRGSGEADSSTADDSRDKRAAREPNH